MKKLTLIMLLLLSPALWAKGPRHRGTAPDPAARGRRGEAAGDEDGD